MTFPGTRRRAAALAALLLAAIVAQTPPFHAEASRSLTSGQTGGHAPATATTTRTVATATTPTATRTPSPTATRTATVRPTATRTTTPTRTATHTATPTHTATATRTATATATPSATARPTLTPVPAGGMQALLNGFREVDYYPSANGWTYMWTNWRPATIDADFATIQAMHANLVRVNVFPGTFGYPTPAPTMMAELASVVQMAANHGLRVDLELFDWFPTYSDIAGSKQWARAVMAPYAGDPRIAFVCLQNEIALATNPAAVTWAQQMVPYLRSIDGGLPLTISSPGGNTLTGDLQTLVTDFPPGSGLDFYDYHYYSAPELAHAAIAQAKTVARGAALYVGETGHTTLVTDTVNGVESVQAAHEAYQDQYLRSVQLAAQQLGVGAASPWLLTDFTPGAIPPISFGADVPREYDMGLLRTDGSTKPAAASLSAYYGTGTVDPSYNQGFETSFISGTVALPTAWRLGSAGTAHYAVDTSVAHSGLASLRISDAMTGTTGSPQIFVDPIDQNIVPGQTYTFSAWAQGLNATGSSHLTLFWRDINGTTISSVMSPNIARGTTPWNLLSVSAVVPSTAVAVRLALTSANNSGTVWFDDVSFS